MAHPATNLDLFKFPGVYILLCLIIRTVTPDCVMLFLLSSILHIITTLSFLQITYLYVYCSVVLGIFFVSLFFFLYFTSQGVHCILCWQWNINYSKTGLFSHTHTHIKGKKVIIQFQLISLLHFSFIINTVFFLNDIICV